jgi:zinc protease
VHEALNAVAFQAHPYRRPIIGWMNDLENMTWQDARDWYRTWYAPNNAYLLVVGDVDHRNVFKLAQQTYGRNKSAPVPVTKPQAEPEQKGIRRLSVKAPAKLPYLAMAWKVPKLVDVRKDREAFALEALAGVLDGHDAARFSKRLVRELQIAQSTDVSYDDSQRGDALFTINGQPAEGKTITELEAALRAELERVRNDGVTAEELTRVKTQIIASQIYKRDSLMAQAMEIGSSEAAGIHWRDMDVLIEQLKTVTPEEVQAVAKKYFNDDTLTVAVLDPQPIDDVKPKARGFAGRH